jgi:hypothetical protein
MSGSTNSAFVLIYFIILGIAGNADDGSSFTPKLALIAAIALFAWISNYRQLRIIANTPLSRIDSAAEGYVEILGRAEQLDEAPLLSHLTQTPCLWYRYLIQEGKFTTTGISDKSFLINDNSGRCAIDPKSAEIKVPKSKSWREGTTFYYEWLLLTGDSIYVCGEFANAGDASRAFDLQGEVDRWLTALKNDRPQLLARFDLNRDGEIDATEWELAQHQARREVEAKHRAELISGSTNVLRKPADGRPFLITTDSPARLESSYRWWNWAHIGVFFVAGTTAFVQFIRL